MSNTPRKTVVSSAAKVAEETEKSLPEVESIGLAPSARGWVVVSITTKGDKVIDREVLSVDPEPKAYAARRAMQEIIKAFVMPAPGGAKQ